MESAHPIDSAAEAALRSIIREAGRAAVMFSGGADSSLLAALTFEELREDAAALTISSPLLPAFEAAGADALAKRIGIRHVKIEMNELGDDDFSRNTPERCYFCKRLRLKAAVKWAEENGFPWLFDGSNADDTRDYRPGMRALREYQQVRSPLLEAGFTKADIRALSRSMGLPTWDMPARACLASRIPYGEAVTAETLRMVEKAEDFLAGMLPRTSQFRVRAHGKLARIEADAADAAVITAAAKEVCAALEEAGFRYVTMDMKGYRTGSLNEGLTIQHGNGENA